jgi:uncharacterized protein (DUF1697 family)
MTQARLTRHIVLLRAVNVGGHNKVPMPTLRELATGIGYTDPVTYVQSGNLLVSAATAKPEVVGAAIADALRSELGVEVDVIVRTAAEIATVIADNPFTEQVNDPRRLLVSFLTGQPAAEKLQALDRDEFTPERFEFGDRCMYQWLPDGVGRSKLAAAPWDRRLGVRGTGRNWRTITTLLEMAEHGGIVTAAK